MLKPFMILLFVTLAGCATLGSRMNKVSLGMTKAEVIDVLGTPNSTKAFSPREILVYDDVEVAFRLDGPKRTEYWVALQDGRVYFYGKAGDFGSAQPPTQRVILDQTVRSN